MLLFLQMCYSEAMKDNQLRVINFMLSNTAKYAFVCEITEGLYCPCFEVTECIFTFFFFFFFFFLVF